MMETLTKKAACVLRDAVEIVAYDGAWPRLFEAEKGHLCSLPPPGLVTRVEHFGSTAVPGLGAHPEWAWQYERLKLRLSRQFAHDRAAYDQGKTEFMETITNSG